MKKASHWRWVGFRKSAVALINSKMAMLWLWLLEGFKL